MNIDEKDIITLSNDIDYFVVKKIYELDKTYYYISNIKNPWYVKFLYEDENELVEIENEVEIKKVIDLILPTIDIDDFLRELKVRLEEKKMNDTNNLI